MKVFTISSKSVFFNALLFVACSFMFSHESFAQTTFSFEPSDGWPDSNGSTETVSGGTLTQSIYQFTSSSSMFTNDGISTAGTQSIWATGFTNGETFTLETTDGSEFDFRSLELIVYIDDAGIATAEGFKNGVSTGTQTTGTGFGAALATGTDGSTPVILSASFDNSIFNDVDRVVLTSGNNFGWSNNHFDELVIGPADPLPITLGDFRAERFGNAINLTWFTISEQNNKGFEIEQSEDGQTFEQIGFVEGAGTSNEKHQYEFRVWNPEAVYFRFKQVDIDGQFSYSPMRFIAAIEAEAEPRLYPNPIIGNLFISNIRNDEHLIVEVLDIQGRQLSILSGYKHELEYRLSQEFDLYPHGLYLVKLRTSYSAFYQKVIKQ